MFNTFIKMWFTDLLVYLNIKKYQKYITLKVIFENKVDAVEHFQLLYTDWSHLKGTIHNEL